MTVKEVEAIILKDGWIRVPSNSSHRQYKHPVKTGRVTIAWHKAKDEVPPKTLKKNNGSGRTLIKFCSTYFKNIRRRFLCFIHL